MSRGFTADGRIKPDIMGIGATAATITPEGNTAWKDGTSFSAPIIAGLTACLRQALPDLSAQEIVGLITLDFHYLFYYTRSLLYANNIGVFLD